MPDLKPRGASNASGQNESKSSAPLTGPAAEQAMNRLTRRSFTVGTAAALAGLGAWTWLTTATSEDGLPWPLRRMLRLNQRLAEGYLAPGRLAPTFPAQSVQGPPRTNGLVGLTNEVNGASWQLRVQHEGRADQVIDLRAALALPRCDLITELKCVEGWSQVMHFGGVRFIDFVTKFALATRSGRAPDPRATHRISIATSTWPPRMRVTTSAWTCRAHYTLRRFCATR